DGSVQATFSNGEPALGLLPKGAYGGGAGFDGRWTATWTPSRTPAQSLTVTVTAQSVDRRLEGVIQLGGPAQDDPAVPLIDDGAVVGSAAYNGNPAPGTMVTVLGSRFAEAVVYGSDVPRPVDLQGTSVFIGETVLPLLYASPGQINAILPWD